MSEEEESNIQERCVHISPQNQKDYVMLRQELQIAMQKAMSALDKTEKIQDADNHKLNNILKNRMASYVNDVLHTYKKSIKILPTSEEDKRKIIVSEPDQKLSKANQIYSDLLAKSITKNRDTKAKEFDIHLDIRTPTELTIKDPVSHPQNFKEALTKLPKMDVAKSTQKLQYLEEMASVAANKLNEQAQVDWKSNWEIFR